MDTWSYQFYEMLHLAFAPARALSDATIHTFKNPFNPLSRTVLGRSLAASAELFERATRRYGKPAFGLDTTVVDGVEAPIIEEYVWEKPFCRLLHFRAPSGAGPRQSKFCWSRDVRPLRHAAARHGRSLPAPATTFTSPTGATRAPCR